MTKDITKIDHLKTKIHTIRGVKAILDRDLAYLYQVETKVLNQAVKRNFDRFPEDFMFQINTLEFENLKSQIVTSSWGGTRKLPYAFTEHGVAMLSSVLHSGIAIEINIRIMRAFVELRKSISINPEYEQLKEKIQRIESQMETMATGNMVDGILLEKKLAVMNADIRRVSETLDGFQDGYIVIKRPEDGLEKG